MNQGYAVVPLSPLRKVIASRMSDASRSIPHFRVVTELQVDSLLRLRAEVNARGGSKKVSLNDCVIKACAAALVRHPNINIQLVESEIHKYEDAHVSVMVAVDGGVMSPVVRSANKKNIFDIAAETAELATRAKEKRLRIEEIVGGTFSISNLGAYGIEQFDAIINAPQCAILALGSAKRNVVFTEAGEVRAVNSIKATLSVDHRAIDGVAAAEFLATLRNLVAAPERLFAEIPELPT